jgi:hypothetical protein
MGVTLSLFGLQFRVPKNGVMPRLDIQIPMPPGAALPAQSSQSQPGPVPQTDTAQSSSQHPDR